jgi:uncharacterized phage protein (TIGR01671 family)
MVREIAFRAWNKKREFMDSVWLIDWEHEKVCHSKHNQSDLNDCVLMQYTGIEDKNGKAIYEGEVVQFTVNKFGADVEKVVKKGTVYYNNDMTLSVDGWTLANIKSREVIGNIYENPELVTA